MGEKSKVEKKIACPHCKNVITVEGRKGETIEVVCPTCNTKGIFSFSEERDIPFTKDKSIAIAVENLGFNYPKSDKKAVCQDNSFLFIYIQFPDDRT